MAGEAKAQEVLDAVISTGQSTRAAFDTARIERLIAAQDDVAGSVWVGNVRGNSKVGASSGIVLFTARWDDGTQLRERDLVLRYAPEAQGRLWYDYDLARQFRVQQALQGTGVPVPAALWLDSEGAVLGTPGYIMEARPGEAPNPSAFTQGPIAQADPATREAMLDEALGALVRLHALEPDAVGLADFAMVADGANPMAKCVNWYWQTWEWIERADHARMVPVRRWLLDNAPTGGERITHGDSTLHNYMFLDGRLTSVLDWEMSCLARPENDLALQTLGNELFAAPLDSGLPQPPSEAQWIERYVRLGGKPPQDLGYYRRLAGFMIITAIASLQRSMPPEVIAAQTGFLDRIWGVVEGD